MRDYGKVSPQFWVGKTGKALRGNLAAQVLALYLMTSPHANMIGVYYCPIEYMAKETGLSFEGASKGLQSLIEADFCTYDAENELVFVHTFAEHQIGARLKPADKRVTGVLNELEKLPKGVCFQAFRARYCGPYSLPDLSGQAAENAENNKPLRSPFEAPSKPEAEAEAGAGAEVEGLASPPAGSGEPASPPDLSPSRQPAAKPSLAGAVCVALKSVGMGQVNPGNLALRALIDDGAGLDLFVDAGRECVDRGKNFAYLLAVVKGRMADAQQLASSATAGVVSGGVMAGAL